MIVEKYFSFSIYAPHGQTIQVKLEDSEKDKNQRSKLLFWCFRSLAPRSRAVSPGPDKPQGAEAKKSESKPRIRRFVPDIQEIRVRYVNEIIFMTLRITKNYRYLFTIIINLI